MQLEFLKTVGVFKNSWSFQKHLDFLKTLGVFKCKVGILKYSLEIFECMVYFILEVV